MRDINVNFKIDPALKARFTKYAQPYGGMTAVLLRYINEFCDQQDAKQPKPNEPNLQEEPEK